MQADSIQPAIVMVVITVSLLGMAVAAVAPAKDMKLRTRVFILMFTLSSSLWVPWAGRLIQWNYHIVFPQTTEERQ